MCVRRRLLRYVCLGVIAFLIVFVGFSVWLWKWNPPAPNLKLYNTIKMTQPQAIRHTEVVKTYPILNHFGMRFVKPMNDTHLSSSAMVEIIYKTLHGYWYPGNIQMYNAKVIGGPDNGRILWIVESHMLFPHTYPAHVLSIWDWNAWAFKYRSLFYALHFKTKQATTFSFYDATTGKYVGAVRSENF